MQSLCITRIHCLRQELNLEKDTRPYTIFTITHVTGKVGAPLIKLIVKRIAVLMWCASFDRDGETIFILCEQSSAEPSSTASRYTLLRASKIDHKKWSHPVVKQYCHRDISPHVPFSYKPEIVLVCHLSLPWRFYQSNHPPPGYSASKLLQLQFPDPIFIKFTLTHTGGWHTFPRNSASGK